MRVQFSEGHPVPLTYEKRLEAESMTFCATPLTPKLEKFSEYLISNCFEIIFWKIHWQVWPLKENNTSGNCLESSAIEFRQNSVTSEQNSVKI